MSAITDEWANPGKALIGELYRRSTLDPLVEFARVIAHDFLKRPRHYREVSAEAVDLLAKHRVVTGSNVSWPSARQRSALFGSLFGASFCGLSIGFRSAVLAYVQAADASGVTRSGVIDAAAALAGSLKSLEGRVLETIADETRAPFESAVELFRDDTITRVFGLDPVASADWPLAGEERPDHAADAAYLVAEVQRALGIVQVRPAMTQHRFLLLQRVARSGGAALDLLVGGREGASDDRFDSLVGHAYAWEMALQQLAARIDLATMWKDPEYRAGCSPCEQAMMEAHPAGDVSLSGTPLDPDLARLRIGGGGFFSTMTNLGICCCTGDLPCPQASENSMYCCPTATGFTCPSSDCGTCTA